MNKNIQESLSSMNNGYLIENGLVSSPQALEYSPTSPVYVIDTGTTPSSLTNPTQPALDENMGDGNKRRLRNLLNRVLSLCRSDTEHRCSNSVGSGNTVYGSESSVRTSSWCMITGISEIWSFNRTHERTAFPK